MRISDWSSDVCSSDLSDCPAQAADRAHAAARCAMPRRYPPAARVRRRRAARAGEASCAKAPPSRHPSFRQDRKRVVKGKSVSVRVDLGGSRIIKKNNKMTFYEYNSKSQDSDQN